VKKLLPLFSYLFHPLFISVYAVLTYFLFGETYYDYTEIYIVIIQIVIITIFIPVTFYYLLLSMGKVDSIMLSATHQRRIPLVIHALLLVVLINKSIPVTVCPELFYFFVGSLYSTLLALLFVLFGKKASLHMVGMLAYVVFAIGISLHYQTRMIMFVVTLLFCCGLVATSRLEMKAHTERELLLGSLIGALPQIILLPQWL
jgi:hypothetical protein